MPKRQNSLIVKIRDTFSQSWIDYLLLCIIGLYVFRWFKGDFLYFGGDQIYPLNPNSNIYRIVYTWTSNGQGSSSALYIVQWFFYGTAYVFTNIGLSLAGAERLYYYLFYALNGLSMYYMASVVYPSNKDGKRIACWISALFYMFNPVLVGVTPQADFSYTVFPIILGLFIKSINTRFKDKIKLAFFASLFMFGFFLILVNYSLFALLLFSFLLYLCFNIKNSRDILLSFGVFFLIFFLINLWIIVPLFFFLSTRGIAMIKAATFGAGTVIPWEFQSMGLLRNAMINALGFNTRNVYNQPGTFIPFINLLFAIIAFSALLIRPRSKNTIYFAILSIVGIIISNGPNPPFGKIFVWAIENIWILRTFRTTGYVMALTALGYSVLIGLTVSNKIYQMMQNHFYKTKSGTYKIRYAAPKIMVGLIIILVLINGWPLVTGDFFYQYKQWPGNAPVKIPYSYYMADNWLSQDNSQFYRILQLPYIQEYQSYSWHPTWSPPVVPWIISKPYATSDLLSNATYENDYTTMARLAGLLNVKYILVDGYDSKFNAGLLTQLNDQPSLRLVTSFDKIYLYEVNSTYFVPHIYASSQIDLIDGGSDQAVRFIDSGNFTAGKSVLFLSDQLSASDWHFIEGLAGNNGYAPEIVVNDVNPTEYIVNVKASRPFFLVFGEAFDPYWVASVNGKTVNKHFMVNTYANGWYINQTGYFDITLNYWPQSLFNIGIVVSLTTFIALCLYAFYPANKRRFPLRKGKISNAYETQSN